VDTNIARRDQCPDRIRRHSVELDATVISDGAEYPTTVTNLSLDGCGLLGYFAIAEKVQIRIGKLGVFAAQVRWALNGRAGAQFTRRSGPRAAGEGKDVSAGERGAAAIEYGLIAGLIAVALVFALARTGAAVGNSLNATSHQLPHTLEVNTADRS
jgi:Flp pilus assembly pilin Flp